MLSIAQIYQIELQPTECGGLLFGGSEDVLQKQEFVYIVSVITSNTFQKETFTVGILR